MEGGRMGREGDMGGEMMGRKCEVQKNRRGGKER